MAHHLVERETLTKANSAVMLGIVLGGLAVCAIGAVIFDIGRLLGAW